MADQNKSIKLDQSWTLRGETIVLSWCSRKYLLLIPAVLNEAVDIYEVIYTSFKKVYF